MILGYWVIGIVAIYLLAGLRVIQEYQRGVKFNLGKYLGIMQPGLKLVLPIIQSMIRVDMRIIVIDVPHQEAITKDNVSVNVNAVLYYKVRDAKPAILEVEAYNYAVSQLAQTTMRNIIGEFELDDLLSKREVISNKIRKIVDVETDPWGIQITSVELKDVALPPDIKRVMGKAAEAEREKRAVIIKSEGEVQASRNLAKAANTLSLHDGALHLRTLHTINDISSDKSNTVVLGIPLEVLKAFAGNRK